MSNFSSSVVSVLANISHKLLIFCWLLIGFHAIDECTVSRLQADSPGREKQVIRRSSPQSSTIKPPVSASKRRFILPQRAWGFLSTRSVLMILWSQSILRRFLTILDCSTPQNSWGQRLFWRRRWPLLWKLFNHFQPNRLSGSVQGLHKEWCSWGAS